MWQASQATRLARGLCCWATRGPLLPCCPPCFHSVVRHVVHTLTSRPLPARSHPGCRFIEKLNGSNALVGELFQFVNKNCPAWTAAEPDGGASTCQSVAANTSFFQQQMNTDVLASLLTCRELNGRSVGRFLAARTGSSIAAAATPTVRSSSIV